MNSSLPLDSRCDIHKAIIKWMASNKKNQIRQSQRPPAPLTQIVKVPAYIILRKENHDSL